MGRGHTSRGSSQDHSVRHVGYVEGSKFLSGGAAGYFVLVVALVVAVAAVVLDDRWCRWQ